VPQRLLGGLHRVEDALTALLVSALLLLSLVQIAMRLFFHSGLDWAEPVSRVGVLWLALLGALGAARAHRHIAIDALPKLLPPSSSPVAGSVPHATTNIIASKRIMILS